MMKRSCGSTKEGDYMGPSHDAYLAAKTTIIIQQKHGSHAIYK